jgi:hypothetical protein
VRLLYRNSGYILGGEPGRVLEGLLMVCLILGALRLWQTQRALMVFSWCPVIMVFLAALAGKFPFEGRLITFLVPGCLITVAVASESPAALTQRFDIWRGTLIGGLVFLPVMACIQRLTVHEYVEELRPVLKAIKGRVRPGDTIYV